MSVHGSSGLLPRVDGQLVPLPHPLGGRDGLAASTPFLQRESNRAGRREAERRSVRLFRGFRSLRQARLGHRPGQLQRRARESGTQIGPELGRCVRRRRLMKNQSAWPNSSCHHNPRALRTFGEEGCTSEASTGASATDGTTTGCHVDSRRVKSVAGVICAQAFAARRPSRR
ncbi:unnamed protein product [Protopolystoma xenopodis]|uniref:Uncharacterized protein n=1 Tax=Protopolystoma xenopodis TaxID=117903 RepID=A0A448WBG9_9PLAT|nr:unnamed protein product [Protopolystoma xenopodis]